MCILTGPPGDINDMNILPDSITACSVVVQWNESSNNPVCGSVLYTVTVSTEGGLWSITANTTITHHVVTGLNSSTDYIISVTASNNAGNSSRSDTTIMTESNGKSPFICSLTVLFIYILTFA